MANARVYVETTIPSFYHDARLAPEIVALREWTRRWWSTAPDRYELVTTLASFHKCDFLVTWNCQHLANANKFGHIRRVNTLLGIYVPALVTPLELLGEHNERD